MMRKATRDPFCLGTTAVVDALVACVFAQHLGVAQVGPAQFGGQHCRATDVVGGLWLWLGALVGEVNMGGQQVPYILFLASGSICMSAMNAASFEALYSAFSRMHMQKTWDGIMNAPVRLDDVVLAEMLWAAYKALFTVTAILGVMLVLGISHSWKLLLAWPVLWLVGVTFSCIALIFNAMAKGYDFFTYYFTLFLTPMMFLSGIYFPRTQLPEWLQTRHRLFAPDGRH
jgi:Nod factor-specific ABC transporter NodJ protein